MYAFLRMRQLPMRCRRWPDRTVSRTLRKRRRLRLDRSVPVLVLRRRRPLWIRLPASRDVKPTWRGGVFARRKLRERPMHHRKLRPALLQHRRLPGQPRVRTDAGRNWTLHQLLRNRFALGAFEKGASTILIEAQKTRVRREHSRTLKATKA